MSEKNMARRAAFQVRFAGTDITKSVEPYLLQMTYVDNEEDETDDLQLKLQDRDGIWLEKWLNSAIQAAAEGGKTLDSIPVDEDNAEYTTAYTYKVTAASGVNAHGRPGEQYYVYGTLAYGTVITSKGVEEGWVNFDFERKNAYVKLEHLTCIGSQQVKAQKSTSKKKTSSITAKSAANTASSNTAAAAGTWNIGDEVVANGQPQYSSYGNGTPGAAVTNYTGKITYLNLKSGIPYPICVGYLGWFAESQVKRTSESTTSTSSDERAASKGLKISAIILRENWNSDGKDDMLDCGQFELDSIDASGPPATITIKATSLPYASTVRQTQKSKSWENTTLSAIAKKIANSNGMACMFESSSDPSYKRTEQYRISDIGFLKKLCHDAGCSLKVTNNIIVIFDQAKYEKKKSVFTIKHGAAGGYIKYKLTTGDNDTYTSCRVSYTTSNGAVISATAYVEDYKESKSDDTDKSKNQCLEVRQKVSSKDEAQALAHKMLRLHNKFEFTAAFTFPGNPSLVAGNAVTLQGWGAFDGKYIIKQAKHSITSSGYTTQITLRKSLDENADSAVKSNSTTSTSGNLDDIAMAVIRGDWSNGAERKQKLTEAGYDYAAVQKRVNEILGG